MFRLLEAFSRGVQALGLTWGAAKGDLKLTAEGPVIGEIAARLSGGYMSGWTYPYASGIDLTEEALLLAVGERPRNLFRPFTRTEDIPSGIRLRENEEPFHSAERAWISIPGRIRSVSGYEQARTVPFVRELFPRASAGDAVVFPTNNVEKCGNIISRAPSGDEAVTAAETAVREIFLRLEPGNAETESFLESSAFKESVPFPPSAFTVSGETAALLRALPDFSLLPVRSSGSLRPGPERSSVPNQASAGLQYPRGFTIAPLPEFLIPCLDTCRDWYGMTLRDAITRAAGITGVTIPIESREEALSPSGDTPKGSLEEPRRGTELPCAEGFFWRRLLRGGIQGAVYTIDSLMEGIYDGTA
jgi:hypothetical protein